MTAGRKFLTCEWRRLLMVNFEIDPEVLRPHVPAGTELDLWQGRAVASIVGFQFRHTRVMGLAVFESQPESAAVRRFLGRTIRQANETPRYIVTDQGGQFTAEGSKRWCDRRGIRQRFGAVGKYGSIAVVERLNRTLKDECTRRLLVPHGRTELRRELDLYVAWYNGDRPHSVLEARTPDEVYFDRPAACAVPRYEPRPRWPRGSPCAGPRAQVHGQCGARVELRVAYRSGRKHLPVVKLQRAA